MLQLKNGTPFKASLMLLPDVDGIDTVYAVVKGTFTLGSRLTLADEQVPVVLADQHHADPAGSSIKVASDVCLGKQHTDVVLLGSACAPAERPVWHMDVSLAVGSVRKAVRVFGDRVWDARTGVATIAHLTPFVRMPLTWERAYGGMDETEQGPAGHPRNPVGTGFRARGGTKPIAGTPVPNVEDPAALITSHEISTYHDKTEPLVSYYEEHGVLYRIDGRPAPDEVGARVEALLATCRERNVAVQTIKAVARRRWRDDDGRHFSWYEPLADAQAIGRAVRYVLSNPQLFLNTSSDARLLQPTLDAASSADATTRPGDDQLQADIVTLGIEPLFDGAALERI